MDVKQEMDTKALCKKLHQLMAAEQMDQYEEVSSSPQPPASDDEISELKKALGVELPVDYVEFLKTHDGWWGFGDKFYDLQSTSGEGETYNRSEGEDSIGMGAEFNDWFKDHGDRVVVVGVGHRCQVVLDPESGEVFEFYLFEQEGHHESFRAFLQAYLDELEEFEDMVR